MKTILKTSILFLLMIVMTISCTKEGKQGETGPAGTNGTNGTNGTDGNANVTSINYTGNWIYQGGSEWNTTLNVPSITSNIIDNGAVFTYFSGDGGITWIALPTYVAPVSMVVLYQVGLVKIAAGGGSAAPAGTSFKVVIIEGSAIIANPDIDYTNYYEVKGAFNLKD